MHIQISKILTISVFIFAAIFGLQACQPKRPRPQSSDFAETAYLDHTVRYRGETLGLISLWYTGNTNNWKMIADANPRLKPNQITLGDRIRIPRRYIVESRPLPEGFIAKRLATKTKTTKEVETQVAPTDNTVVEQPQPVENSASENTEMPASDQLPTTEAPQVAVDNNTVQPATGTAPTAGNDAEREKLLEELLAQ
ncbi:LysM peptidoglycan-binding domain-containing protein [bacterium]|nr:LysM peptidoglycan-binding domain-containing protein [bacterium]